jgi:small nuclear ribonucleoprotein (snRNP)-like protein
MSKYKYLGVVGVIFSADLETTKVKVVKEADESKGVVMSWDELCNTVLNKIKQYNGITEEYMKQYVKADCSDPIKQSYKKFFNTHTNTLDKLKRYINENYEHYQPLAVNYGLWVYWDEGNVLKFKEYNLLTKR